MSKSWKNTAISVGGYSLHTDANIKLTSVMFEREPNNDQFAALNEEDQAVNELSGGSNTLTLNLKLTGPTPQATALTLRGLESRKNGDVNQPILLNQWAKTLVPTAAIPVFEFNAPVLFSGLLGGAAGEAYNSENSWPCETYEEVAALPVTPATPTATDLTGGDALIKWDVDTEKYVRQAELDRVAYFVVERTTDPAGAWTVVSPAGGVANTAGTSGQVEYTDSPTAGAWRYRVKAVDQYGMASAYTAELTVTVT